MASEASDDEIPSGSLALSLAFEHLNLVYNVGLQDFREWLPDVPPDSLLYVDIAKDALESAAADGGDTSEEVLEYASTLAAIKRRIEGDGSQGSDEEKFGEQELEELRMWAESRRHRSALQELYDLIFLEKSASEETGAFGLENEQAIDKGKRPQAEEEPLREEEAAEGPARDGPGAAAGPSGEAELPPLRHVRKRKVVEYEEEPEPVPPKRNTRRVDEAAGNDASERQASPSPARRKKAESVAGKEAALGEATRPGREPTKDVHEPREPGYDLRKPHKEPKEAVPEPKKPAGRPTAPKGASEVAPVATEKQAQGSRGQQTGGKAGWGSLHLDEDSGAEQPKKPPPMTLLLSPPVGGGGPGGAGASATQCFSCKKGSTRGSLIPCLGGCGKHFHASCPGLSQPSPIEVMSQRCEQCLESLEEAAKAARTSAQKKAASRPVGTLPPAPAPKTRTGRPAATTPGQNGRAGDASEDSGEGVAEEEHEDGEVDEQGAPAADDEVDDIEEDSEEPRAHHDLRDKGIRRSVPMKRRKAKRGYSKEEDAKLVAGMEKYKDEPNKWQKILHFGRKVFIERDPVSLKDRWRNLQKYL